MYAIGLLYFAEILTRSHFLDGKFWDFTSDLAKGDMAYTTLALGAHTDNTYFASISSHVHRMSYLTPS
jgi:hypothetical protein